MPVSPLSINRRSFLLAAASLAVAQYLTGCNRTEVAALRVSLLSGSMPGQLLREFQRRLSGGETADFVPQPQLADLFQQLQSWQKQPAKTRADWVTLGDFWLTAAIQQGLIQPLMVTEIPGWQSFGTTEVWKSLVQRDRQGNPTPTGEIWAAPYRWGTLMIAYRVEPFKKKGITPPVDWSDLWRPELQRRISVLDSARSVIGLTLKKLGQSVNVENLDEVPQLKPELASLHQQVKFYSSDAYLQPLVLGDTWAAVGWSTEILPLVEDNHELAAVVPKAGTILTADLWVRPAPASTSQSSGSQPSSPQPSSPQPSNSTEPSKRTQLIQDWLAFCWKDQIATQLSLLSSAASPIFWGRALAQLPKSLQEKPLLIPPPDVMQKSEFLLPLSDQAIEQYRHLWTAVRQS